MPYVSYHALVSSYVTRFCIKILALFFSVGFFSATICAENASLSERDIQVRKNLCTLSLFLQLGIESARDNSSRHNAKNAVYDLLGDDNEADIHAANGQYLAQIYLGNMLVNEIPALQLGDICYLPNIGEVLYDVREDIATAAHASAIRSIAKIKAIPLLSVESSISMLMKIYAETANYVAFLYKSTIHEIVEEGFTASSFKGSLSSDDLLDKMLIMSSQEKNPLYWNPSLLPMPTTPFFWNWYAYGLPQIDDFFRKAIKRIKEGSFDDWWLS